MAKMAKPVKPLGAKPIKLAQAMQPVKVKNSVQAAQGEKGKAQGYLGHLAGKGPQEALKKEKNRKKKEDKK